MKCAERLASAEREPRFGRRNITTDLLRHVWSAAIALEQVPIESLDFVSILLEALGGLNPEVSRLIRANDALLRDSAEQRVTGFDAVVDSLRDLRATVFRDRDSRAMALAVAALLAGRGTSHVQLLAPTARDFPEVLVWYGLLAGLVGPRHWDRAWTQQAKGIERALRQFFRPDEPVQADICWVEYDWLARTYDSVEALTRLPRSFLSGLAIEIIPGVVCQFRLGEHGPVRERTLNRTLAPMNPMTDDLWRVRAHFRWLSKCWRRCNYCCRDRSPTMCVNRGYSVPSIPRSHKRQGAARVRQNRAIGVWRNLTKGVDGTVKVGWKLR